MNTTCRRLTDQDLDHFIALINVYAAVFEMPRFTLPAPDYLLHLLRKDSVIILAAFSENKVVGGLTAHLLPSTYFPSAEVYVYDLAVETASQRRGIGRQLMTDLKDYCTTLGMKEIFVQADLDDRHALEFYRATGGIPERVVHFSYPLDRPGPPDLPSISD